MTYMLPTLHQQFIHVSRYARWMRAERRRETFPETIARYCDFFEERFDLGPKAIHGHRLEAENAMLALDVLPSMRCLMTAGDALVQDNIAGYNCAYRAITHPRYFSEILYILMCGTGVGYSVERQYVARLPDIPESLVETDEVVIVSDSRRGWAESLNKIIKRLYSGKIVKWDVSRVRKKGTPLRTMGGRASGPEPLVMLFQFCINMFCKASGRKLTSLECHDIVCKIGDCVVVGGVRRSAMLSLSNLSDTRMRDAKTGNWWEHYPWRAMANNSVAYKERPDMGHFMNEWLALYNSKSGERGFFSREAATKQVQSIGRRKIRNDKGQMYEFGTNPCSEIILRDAEFCNLTEVVARADDDIDSLLRKVRLATMMGTWQSTLTDFNYINMDWLHNCQEERLLGVSITGIMDNPLLNGTGSDHPGHTFMTLKRAAIEENEKWAKILNINPAAAITCVKPSGTASLLAGCAAGIHSRYAPHYIRRVRQDVDDPVTKLMIDQGIPHEQCAMKPEHIVIFSFPVESPENAITRHDRTAIQELEHWKLVQDYWCEHKPSVTINVREHEWMGVGAWCWEHFDSLSGLSFLPHDNGTYLQAPLEAITREQYITMSEAMPKAIDWSLLSQYEEDDRTTASKEMSCSAGQCEI